MMIVLILVYTLFFLLNWNCRSARNWPPTFTCFPFDSAARMMKTKMYYYSLFYYYYENPTQWEKTHCENQLGVQAMKVESFLLYSKVKDYQLETLLTILSLSQYPGPLTTYNGCVTQKSTWCPCTCWRPRRPSSNPNGLLKDWFIAEASTEVVFDTSVIHTAVRRVLHVVGIL